MGAIRFYAHFNCSFPKRLAEQHKRGWLTYCLSARRIYMNTPPVGAQAHNFLLQAGKFPSPLSLKRVKDQRFHQQDTKTTVFVFNCICGAINPAPHFEMQQYATGSIFIYIRTRKLFHLTKRRDHKDDASHTHMCLPRCLSWIVARFHQDMFVRRMPRDFLLLPLVVPHSSVPAHDWQGERRNRVKFPNTMFGFVWEAAGGPLKVF